MSDNTQESVQPDKSSDDAAPEWGKANIDVDKMAARLNRAIQDGVRFAQTAYDIKSQGR